MIACISCNSSSKNAPANAIITHDQFVPPQPEMYVGHGVNIDEVIKRKGRILDNACTIVPQKTIADALGLTPQDLILRNSTPRDNNPTHSSCFFKWEDYDLPNAGIMLQMMRNPNEEEFPNWVYRFIESYRNSGERGMDEQPVYYKKLEGFGDDGAYSTEGGKYFWRIGDKVIFGIAFNTTHGPVEQFNIAASLAKVMTENYLK